MTALSVCLGPAWGRLKSTSFQNDRLLLYIIYTYLWGLIGLLRIVHNLEHKMWFAT